MDKVFVKTKLFLFAFAPFLLFTNGIEDAKIYHANSELQRPLAIETINLIPWKESERVLDNRLQ